jgi:hypothetical protein
VWVVCVGFVVVCSIRLIPYLHTFITNDNTHDADNYYNWWIQQTIAGGGVPDHVVPDDKWPMDKYNMGCTNCSTRWCFSASRGCWPWSLSPPQGLSVGPLYLVGDCSDTGTTFSFPWLFLIAISGLLSFVYDVWMKWNVLGGLRLDSPISHFFILGFLSLMAIMMIFPLYVLRNKMLETRTKCSAALRQVLASRAFCSDITTAKTGVRIEIIGAETDRVAQTVFQFTVALGHSYSHITPPPTGTDHAAEDIHIRMWDHRTKTLPFCYTIGCVCMCGGCDPTKCAKYEPCGCNRKCRDTSVATSGSSKVLPHADLRIRVHIMSSYAHRNALFDPQRKSILDAQRKRTVFVWTGSDEQPQLNPKTQKWEVADAFNCFKWEPGEVVDGRRDEVGAAMMGYLIILAPVEGDNLAHALFSSISAKVVDLLKAGV